MNEYQHFRTSGGGFTSGAPLRPPTENTFHFPDSGCKSHGSVDWYRGPKSSGGFDRVCEWQSQRSVIGFFYMDGPAVHIVFDSHKPGGKGRKEETIVSMLAGDAIKFAELLKAYAEEVGAEQIQKALDL